MTGMDDLRAHYLAGLPPTIAALEAAVDAGDGGGIRRIAHRLKGSGASFGFPDVSRDASAVLDAGAGEEAVAAGPLLERLRSAHAEGSGRSLLVVDDDPAIRMLLRAALGGRFDRIEEAASLEEARERLGGTPPSLVLLDLLLGEDDGRSLLAEIRSSPEWAKVPVGVLSAHSGPEVREDCIRLGADGYLEKPFDPGSLGGRIDALIGAAGDPALRGEPPAGESATPDGVRVLLAEDDQIVADLVADRLRRRGYSVTHCADGREALDAASAGDFSLAIIDVAMPKVNGFEVLGTMRGMRRHSGTPVLMLTGMNDEGSVVRAFDLGADDYVLKPFSPTELVARVARMIGA
jgi:DNA-binding response OmpR family regulator